MYTIKIKSLHSADEIAEKLSKAVERSRFTAQFERSSPNHVMGTIHVKPVRLKEAKPYCGQHPGECDLGARRKGKWLEWDDWVEFHGLVNSVLDRLEVSADAWTNPAEKLDVGKKMWVRRGLKGRKHWSFDLSVNPFGRTFATWNHGTPDQFE